MESQPLKNMESETQETIETLDSTNEEQVAVDVNDSPDALKEKFEKLSTSHQKVLDNNRRLFARAKKAEGFELDADGKWIKLEKPKADDDKSKAKPKQKDGLDYGMKAYLRSEGIEAEYFGFVQEQMEESGLELESLLANGYFKQLLQEKRNKASIDSAIPSKTRNVSESAKTRVDHWVEKGELPPNTPENAELRSKVLAAREARERTGNNFSQQPVVYAGQ